VKDISFPSNILFIFIADDTDGAGNKEIVYYLNSLFVSIYQQQRTFFYNFSDYQHH